MRKNTFKKIFLLFFILNLFLIGKVFAATFVFSAPKNSPGIGEQFYIDLKLDPGGESINTLEGSIRFQSEYVSFVRVEDGKSIVGMWIEEPKLSGETVRFTGIIPNGFDGMIDPFDSDHKLPGLVVRLVFEAKKTGQASFDTSPFNLNLNDGLGTPITSLPTQTIVNIDNFVNKIKYENKTEEAPKLEAFITQDQNIFDNKYILVFKAQDKETGIKSVMIKEGRRDWQEIKSPYLLKDQSRHSMITLQAVNFSGAGIILNIERIPYDWEFILKISGVFIIIFIISFLSIKKICIYLKNKKMIK